MNIFMHYSKGSTNGGTALIDNLGEYLRCIVTVSLLTLSACVQRFNDISLVRPTSVLSRHAVDFVLIPVK